MKFNSKMTKYALAAAMVAVAMAPEMAHAANTLDQTFTQLGTQTAAAPKMITWFGYIVGSAFVAFGVFKLKAHADNASQNKLGPALGLLFTGAAFLSLPSVANMLDRTNNITGSISYDKTGFGSF